MTLTAYVRADAPELVVDVTGADPGSAQTAQVKLWSGRTPTAQASGSVAALAQTWSDSGSGQTFGAMAAISAGGRNVTASTPNNLARQVSFQPNSDGSFRVIAVSPKWDRRQRRQHGGRPARQRPHHRLGHPSGRSPGLVARLLELSRPHQDHIERRVR